MDGPTPPSERPSGLSRWLSTHRSEALIGAGAAVAAFAWYRSRQASTAASASGASSGLLSAPLASTGYSATPTYGYDSTSLDQYGTLSSAISQQNDTLGQIQSELTANAVANNTTPQGAWSANPLGNQWSPQEKQAFLGTELYNGNAYNVYNLSGLEQAGGPAGWLNILYPGQNLSAPPSTVVLNPTGSEVAVPVFGGYGPIPANAILAKS